MDDDDQKLPAEDVNRDEEAGGSGVRKSSRPSDPLTDDDTSNEDCKYVTHSSFAPALYIFPPIYLQSHQQLWCVLIVQSIADRTWQKFLTWYARN
jgi:hypothetical protein